MPRPFYLGDSVAGLLHGTQGGSGAHQNNLSGHTVIGASPARILSNVSRLTPQQVSYMQSNGVVLSSGTNNPSDRTSTIAAIRALIALGVPAGSITVTNISNRVPGASGYNSALSGAAGELGFNIADVSGARADRYGHPNVAQYQRALDSAGRSGLAFDPFDTNNPFDNPDNPNPAHYSPAANWPGALDELNLHQPKPPMDFIEPESGLPSQPSPPDELLPWSDQDQHWSDTDPLHGISVQHNNNPNYGPLDAFGRSTHQTWLGAFLNQYPRFPAGSPLSPNIDTPETFSQSAPGEITGNLAVGTQGANGAVWNGNEWSYPDSAQPPPPPLDFAEPDQSTGTRETAPAVATNQPNRSPIPSIGTATNMSARIGSPGQVLLGVGERSGQHYFNDGGGWKPIGQAGTDVRWGLDTTGHPITGNYNATQYTKYWETSQDPGAPNVMPVGDEGRSQYGTGTNSVGHLDKLGQYVQADTLDPNRQYSPQELQGGWRI